MSIGEEEQEEHTPKIEVLHIEEAKRMAESRKAPSTAIDEASKSNKIQNDLSINSIPQFEEKYTEND